MAGVDQQDLPGPDPLTRLRTAAAAVAELDGSGDDAGHGDDADHSEHAGPDDQVGSGAQAGSGEQAGFDAGEHADRFSELHDALVTVLADVDRG